MSRRARRRSRRNPAGADVVGFMAGASAAVAGGLFLLGPLGVPFVGGGVAVVAGIAAALGGANSPGFFRGAAVGGGATLLGSLGLLASLRLATPASSPPAQVGP